LSQIVLYVLCEGQTEDVFVNRILKPYLKSFGVIVKSQILLTNVKKNIAGGITEYNNQVKRDLKLMFKSNLSNDHIKYYFTTMFDLYALPSDFPDKQKHDLCSDCYNKVELIEKSFNKDINRDDFIAYMQLHEFEALVFSNLDGLILDYIGKEKAIDNLKIQLSNCSNNPELINNNPQTAPSKRLEKALYPTKYNKPKSGITATQNVGIEYLKSKCHHFGEWVEKLEKLS